MAEKEFPWNRRAYIPLVERLMKWGARVVVFDIVFMAEKAEDADFAAVLEKYRDRIVVGFNQEKLYDKESGLQHILQKPNATLIPEWPNGRAGFVFHHPDLDGDLIVRHVDYRTSDLRENGALPDDPTPDWVSLSARAIERATGQSIPQGYRHPIGYFGGANTYDFIPMENLFVEKRIAEAPIAGGAYFKDKIVFIGPTYDLLHDKLTTPFGEMPGVVWHAQVAADLLNGAPLHYIGRNASLVCFGICIALTALCVILLRNAIGQSASLFGAGVSYVGVCQFAFVKMHAILPMAMPLAGVVTVGSLGVIYSFLLEQWEKAHTRKVLNRFVSKRIAAVVLKNAEEFEHARRGEKRPVAVFFSDIRSFTTWSENAAPENLVGQLNEYFERAVTHIEEREGNVQKFIGDAILAAWGDTHSNGFADDAARAVATALTMRVTLRALNAGWDKREDRIVISIGMGINHGDVVVGEVGHPERREYTVLGDGVNFAARLESATKQFHTDCLVGESVEVLTRDRFVYRHADFVRVKGKNKPVNIFIPLSDVTTPPPEWLADYHKAHALYVERKFTEAAALFRAVNSRIGGEDYLCETYATRCDRYAQEPPPADWDGSYTLTEK